jgi:hypothetical protein
MPNFQSGVVLESEILGKGSKGLDMKSSIKQAIREGSVNWMEFTMRSDMDGLDDCSEVLLNYYDGGLMNSDEEKLKTFATREDGSGKLSKTLTQRLGSGKLSKTLTQRLHSGPAKQKDKREARGWFWIRKDQMLQPHLGFL